MGFEAEDINWYVLRLLKYGYLCMANDGPRPEG